MKKVTLFAASVCCALSIISCSKEDNSLGADVASVATPTNQMITFNDPFIDVQTRAEITPGTLTNQRANVKVFRGSTLQANILLSESNGRWYPSPSTPWFKNDVYTFRATMPDPIKLNDAGDKIENIAISKHINSGYDILYAAVENLPSEEGMANGVSLNFRHIYNKIQVVFNKPTGSSYRVRITSAKFWLPKGTVNWDVNNGPLYTNDMVYHQELPADAVTETGFEANELGTGYAGSISGVHEYLLLPPASGKSLYGYLDVNYELIDTNGNPFETNSVVKQPIEIASTDGFANGGKALRLNINFDLSGVTNMQFTSTLTHWDTVSTPINY